MLYQIIPSLQEFIGDMPLLGHNLEFDLKFLCRAGLDVTPETRRYGRRRGATRADLEDEGAESDDAAERALR